jgi:hypothetical protein
LRIATRAGPRRTLAIGLAAASLLACADTSAAAPVAARVPRLLYAEGLSPVWQPAAQPRARAAGGGGEGTMRFQAYGRSFALELAPNRRLSPPSAGFTVQSGTLASAPGSWARITRRGADIIGVFSDGEELFGIEPAAALGEFFDPATPLPAGHNLIYRLSDLLLDPSSLACGLQAGAGRVSAAAAVAALTDELGTPQMARALGPMRRITLAPVADSDFASRYGRNAQSEVLARLNVVDGIFREQVGIDIAVGAPEVFTSDTGPYPLTSTVAATLLDQVSDYRLAQHGQYGLTHLFTGKRLDENLVGIGWQSAVCFAREGAALSTSAGITANLSALVAAHEIGHNFGAPHDGEPASPCALTPTTFLMAARVSSNGTFSSCSLEQMSAVIESRARSYPACLTTLAAYDVALDAPDELQGFPGEATSFAVTVRNLGTQGASGVSLRLTVPAALSISSISPDRGACAPQTDGASCNLDSLPAESDWQVTFEVRSEVVGRFYVTARASAASDELAANDFAQFYATIGTPEQLAAASGGGGGAIGLVTLAAVGLGAALRRRRYRC